MTHSQQGLGSQAHVCPHYLGDFVSTSMGSYMGLVTCTPSVTQSSSLSSTNSLNLLLGIHSFIRSDSSILSIIPHHMYILLCNTLDILIGIHHILPDSPILSIFPPTHLPLSSVHTQTISVFPATEPKHNYQKTFNRHQTS